MKFFNIRRIVIPISMFLLCLLILTQSEGIYKFFDPSKNLPPLPSPKLEETVNSFSTSVSGKYDTNGAKIILKSGFSILGTAEVKDKKFTLEFNRQKPDSTLRLLASKPGEFKDSEETDYVVKLEYPTVDTVNVNTTYVSGKIFKGTTVKAFVDGKEFGTAKADSSNKYRLKLKDKIDLGKKLILEASYGSQNSKTSVYVGGGWSMAKDTSGKFHRLVRECNIEPLAEKVKKLFDYADSKGIKTLAAMAPPSVIEGVSILENDRIDFSNAQTTEFLNLMDGYGFNTLDLREEFKKHGYLNNSLYYKYDHHWTVPTALRASIYLNDNLNRLYDLNLNPGGKYNYDKFNSVTYKDYYKGSIALNNVEKNAVDDFTKLWPKFDTNFTLSYYDMSKTLLGRVSGRFEDALMDQSKITQLGQCYSSYLRGWTKQVEIINNKPDNDLNTLIISTSHGRPFSAFMSNFYKKTTFIDLQPGKFDRSVYGFLDELKPDLVLLVYTPPTFGKVSVWDFDRK